MKIEATLGNPTEPGIYAARQWYGWRILEWHAGAWWHPGKAAQWPANAEIEAHFGPLPVISKDYTKPPLGKLRVEEEDWEKRLDWDGQAQYADDAAKEYDL